MGYYDMDDYIEEPRYPEVDEMLDNVREKIKEQLSKDVTDEVIYSSDIYKDCQATIKKLREDACRKDTNLANLEQLLRDKNSQLTRMKKAGSYAEYAVGDECWFVKANSRYEITCPFCKGAGKVKVQIAEGTIPAEFVGETELLCPKCKGETYYWTNQPNRKVKNEEFVSYLPCKGRISRVLIDLYEEEGKDSIKYFATSDRGGMCWGAMCENRVFHSKEEAEELALIMSQNSYNEAAFKTGNEQAKDYDEYVEMRKNSTCTRNL